MNKVLRQYDNMNHKISLEFLILQRKIFRFQNSQQYKSDLLNPTVLFL